MDDLKVSVYVADTKPLEDKKLYEYIYSLSSDVRKEKANKMRFKKDKCLSLGIEYLLMCALKDFGIDYKNAKFKVDEYSKPYIEGENVYFNLSHSENKVMCIISNRVVGCDVEKITPIDLTVAKKYFFKGEYKAIENCKTQSEMEDLFFRYWTLKESFMKCTGLGFRLPLDAFCVSIGEKEIKVEHSVDNEKYSLFEQNLNDGYKYAWCIKGDIKEKVSYDGIIQYKRIGFDC